MQYITDMPISAYIDDTPGHCLAEALEDGIDDLVESMRVNGYDPRRPIIVVCNPHTMNKAGWQWSGDDNVTIAQGRHRWLAATEAGLDEVCAILVTHGEWESLRSEGDANDVEYAMLKNMDTFIDNADEDLDVSIVEF